MMQRWKACPRGDRASEDNLWSRLQEYKRQLDSRYEQRKKEGERSGYEWRQRTEAAAIRKREQVAYHEQRAAELRSRPPVRPGPRQWEFESQREAAIRDHEEKARRLRSQLAEIESKLRNAH